MDKICYYLRHGLWSVVTGLLREDEPVDPQKKAFAVQLLWSAAGDPHNKRFSSRIVRCPWHQSWLAVILIQTIKPFIMDGNIVTMNEVEVMKKETEFQCILYSLPEAASYYNILEELFHHYGQVIRADCVKSLVQGLSEETHNFIRNSFLLDPVTTNAVIQHLLCVWCPHFLQVDCELQNIYTEALHLCMLEMENRNSGMSIKTSHVLDVFGAPIYDQSTEDLCNTLLCIISLLEMSEDKEENLVERFYPRLLDVCESGLVSRQLLFLGVLSRRKLKLAKLLMKLEDDRYERQSTVSDTLGLQKISTKFLDSFGNIQIEEMFLRLVKQEKHWIEDIVDICSHLLMCGKTEAVKKFLLHHTMSKLWPFILIHVWKNFSDRDEIFAVLSFLLEQCKKGLNDPVFSSLCSVVDQQILVVKWCKDHGHRYSLNNRDFLELTMEHSTLEVLRRTAGLEDLELNEARMLLLSNNDQGFPNINKVHGTINEVGNNSWELKTFDGFCVLRKAFAIFQASVEIERLSKKMYRSSSFSSKSDVSLTSTIPVVPAYFIHNYPSVILRHPSLETEHGTSNPVTVETLYKDRITKELQEIKTMLCHLFPLNFRVEILENIFSLLFLRYEDLQEEASSDSGADDDDGDHEQTLPESEITSKLIGSTGYKHFKETEVTHSMTNFQQIGDVSSSLRTMPVIEAHVSGSPSQELSDMLPAEAQHQCYLHKTYDTSANSPTTSPLQVMEMLSPSKISDESRENISRQRTGTKKCSSPQLGQFNKFSSLPAGYVSNAKHSSVPNMYSTAKVHTVQSVRSASLSSDMNSDISQLHGDINQFSKPPERRKSTKSNCSENTSVQSGVSNMTIKGTNQGFICNRYLVRDLLHCLKECLVETSAAFYSSLSIHTANLKKVEVVSSVQPELLQQHMNRLSVCVSEAAWRLQLFTDAEFAQQIGHISVPERISSVSDTEDDWLYHSEESESEDEKEAGGPSASICGVGCGKAQKPASKRSRSETEKSSESGSQSNKSRGGAVTSASSHHKVRWNKCMLKHGSFLSLPTGIINLMLSSQSSLAVRCLIYGELPKAKQVIKMFEENDNPLALEVTFIEAYQTLLNKLRYYVESSQTDSQQTVMSVPPGKKTSTLESIKKAARAGMQSTSLTNQIETFLSVTPIPDIQGADKVVTEYPHEAAMLEGVENSAAMTALDLALTVGATYEHSASLLDAACKRCDVLRKVQSSADADSTKSRNRHVVPGYIWFTRRIIKLLKEANKSQSSSNIFSSTTSLCDLLSSEYLPLSLKTMKDHITFWNSLHDVVVEFQETVDTALSGSSSRVGVASMSSDGCTVKSHVVFRRLLKICKGRPVDERTSGNYIDYLQQVYTYLKLVTSLLQQNHPSETAQHCGLARPVKYFDLFNSSLMVLLGQLVFECDVSPSYLEPVAKKLKLNLVYNVISNCCPKIPNSLLSDTPNFKSGCELNWGRIVLNASGQWSGPIRHPEVAVRSLLVDVLRTVQEQSESFMDKDKNILNQLHLCALAENLTVKTILADTCELGVIDLDLLVPGDETLAFYTNLANLMWIHSLLFLEASPPQSTDLSVLLERMKDRSVVSASVSDQCWTTNFGLVSSHSLERQVARMSIGYNVGKLGFISLQELYKQLQGELTFPSASSLKNCSFLGKVLRGNTFLLDSSSVDPRVLFVLLNGQKQSPKIQVLFAESVDVQLDGSMTEFLDHSVKFDSKSQQLVIPELLHFYLDYVQLNQEPESHSAVPAFTNVKTPHHFYVEQDDDQISTFYSRERLTQLVDFLRDNTSGQLQIEITKFASALSDPQTHTPGTIVKVEKFMNEFSILLDYSRFEDGTSVTAVKSNENCDFSEDTWKHRVVQDSVLKFLECHCWMLSVLVRRVHQEKALHASPVNETPSHKMIDERIKCLEQLFRSKWVDVLKPVFQNNLIVAALHSKPDMTELWCLLDQLVKKREWRQCAEILWALPETELQNDPKLQTFHDVVMYELASKLPDEGRFSPWWYCQHIGDLSVQAQCLLLHLPRWPGRGCRDALKVVLGHHHQKLSTELKLQLQEMLHKITIYEKIVPFAESAGMNTWFDVSCTSEKNPGLILELLMEAKEFQICLEWAKLQNIATRAQHLVDFKFLLLFLEHDSSDFSSATKLLESLPIHQTVAICNELIQQLRSVLCLKFITTFIVNSCSSYLSSEQLDDYQNLSIGIQMMAVIPYVDQVHHWDLIWKPHLIVEQFIMNTRLEMLEKMISEVCPLLARLPATSPVSLSSIDTMLRHYASKALDFRVVRNPAPCQSFPYEEKLLVSLSLGSTHSKEFLMPAVVPSKNEWVPNDEITECMCCQSVAFSMFNRRHHCRRCGRVICGSCSTQRMKVVGYGTVAVRVCDDCHCEVENDSEQVTSLTLGDDQLPFSLNFEDSVNSTLTWKLTSDEAYNTTLREEFGFEHAPSVSLCLAILKLHSEHVAYPRFLLDACHQMLRLLQPVGPSMANPEVDYSLVIRMVRSLVVAAKVKHARSGLNTGVAHCDQLLSQVDLLNMLVKSGCSALIPAEPLNGHALRRLRDRLVEEELWMLAMEVSTKSGLERTGVWAAWGKACLRAGCWDEARDKFSHCLEKVALGPDSARPLRSPPLLMEIVQILEEGAYTVDRKVIQEADKIRASSTVPAALLSSPALTVLHTLSSLKEIAHGNYPQATPPLNPLVIGPKLDPLFYEECCYYLSSYGSHAGIISFYLSHDDLLAALKHVLSQKVDPEIFLEMIYIPCLRQGLVSDLYHELSTVDPTLGVWKVYLCHICRYFEKQGLLNLLYQLQLHMLDHVRAAMTCIRFYQKGARSYSDLAANLGHLHAAQSHLENELLTAQWGPSTRSSPVGNEAGSKGSESPFKYYLATSGGDEVLAQL
ncbi:uncharacterized protein LOC110829239 isoform X4 [Zootermopsis nevadensis]|uniref:uncharacterized protein LOC110829239 isoform X4 n=1 Tax=Zootermopsis nevadensis TaxID=136037 RepID=UPI000B8EE8D7|nr:uncharacterized protein LOC110829239 isoform X4 [Zootermopsis nevadensis]